MNTRFKLTNVAGKIPEPGDLDIVEFYINLADKIIFTKDVDNTVIALSVPAPVDTVAGRTGDVILTKSDVDLSNVDNTSDITKPISTATQAALDTKISKSDVVDGLTSTVIDLPLSANQGRILKNLIDAIELNLSSNDFTLDTRQKIVDFIKGTRSIINNLVVSDIGGLDAALDTKVDKIVGKELSDENYTLVEKNKLAGIESGAEVNHTAAEIKTLYESNSNTNAFTDNEKYKLSYLESSKFKGQYVSFAELVAAHPTAAVGSYANVDEGVGNEVVRYVWDSNDDTWYAQAGTSSLLTAAQIKQEYESNPDTNAFTDTLLSKLNGIEAGAQVNVATNLTWTAGTTNGPTVNSSTGTGAVIPSASATASGVVTTAAQTFAGVKTFSSTISGSINGNAGTATVLQNARTINGVSFDGSANITITANTTNTLTRGTGLTGNNFNGSAATTWAVSYGTAAGTACQGNDVRLSTNIAQGTRTATTVPITSSTGTGATLSAASTTLAGVMIATEKVKLDGIEAGAQVNVATNLTWTAGTTAGPTVNSSTGTGAVIPSASATASGVVTTGAQTFAGVKTFSSTISGSINGNAGTATTLETARTINGVSFNGSANITITANTSATLTRGTGLTGNNFNGSAATTWAVSYGTTAGTACQGNDTRLSDSREWTATTVLLAEAQAGTATTRRAWTSQMVRESTKSYVDPLIGDINTILDDILGP